MTDLDPIKALCSTTDSRAGNIAAWWNRREQVGELVDEVEELRAEVKRLRARDVLTTAVVEAVTEFRRHTASLSTTNTDAATAAWDATTAALDALDAGGA